MAASLPASQVDFPPLRRSSRVKTRPDIYQAVRRSAVRTVVRVYSLMAGLFYIKTKGKKVVKSKLISKTIQAIIARCVIRSVIQNGCGVWEQLV